MTVHKHFSRTVVAFALALTLLLTPAVPVAADEVGGGWTQSITEWVKGWFTTWHSPATANTDRGFKERVGSSQEPLKLTPDLEPSDKDPAFDPPEIIPSTQEEQTCDGLPENDPFGQC